MNRKRAFVIVIALLFLTTSACQQLGLNKDVVGQEIGKLISSNDVINNVFSSSAMPETVFRITPDFQYLGTTDPIKEVYMRKNDQSSLERASHLFIFPKEGGAAEKGVIIRISTVIGDPSPWPEETAKSKTPCLQSGALEIIEEEYDYCTSVEPDVLFDYEKDLVREKGYMSPTCSLAKKMVRRSGFGNKSHIQLIYFESCNAAENQIFAETSRTPKSTLTNAEQAVFDEFLRRSNKNIQILEKQKVIAPLIYESTAPAPAPETGTGGGTIEEKLERLKNLYEKGLITKEDYDRKKSALLDEL